jgi:DNA-binding NtrC family response regulator
MKRPIILYVEDHEAARKLTSLMLEQQHADVISVGTGLQAIDIIEQLNHVDLLISDICLPDISGCQVSRAFHRKFPKAAILVTTSLLYCEIWKDLPKEANLNFLQKPFRMEKLLESVVTLLPKLRVLKQTADAEKAQAKAEVLLVGKDIYYTKRLRMALERGGYKVRSTNSKEAGLALLEQGTCDLLLMDLKDTARTDLFTFLGQVREAHPQLFVAGIADKDEAQDYENTGIFTILDRATSIHSYPELIQKILFLAKGQFQRPETTSSLRNLLSGIYESFKGVVGSATAATLIFLDFSA